MIGTEIRAARFTLGLSTSEMAKVMGLTRRSIQRMEAGTLDVSLRTALQVSNLLADHSASLSKEHRKA